MMNDFITAKDAEDLNQLVQEKIDPRLFLFCNYEPSPIVAISPDGIFLSRVLELYRFGVDSCSSMGKLLYILQKHSFSLSSLKADLSIIKALRAVLTHCQCDTNGYTSQRLIEDYKLWVKDVIEKDTPESQQDYILLNDKLVSLRNSFLYELKNMMNLLTTSIKQDDLTEEWIDGILRWYCSNTHTDIYYGCLVNLFRSRSLACGNTAVFYYKDGKLNRCLKKWIEKAMTYQQDKRLDELEKSIRTTESVLKRETVIAQIVWSKLSEADRKLQENNMRKTVDEWKRLENIVKQERDSILGEMKKTGVREYLFRQLSNPEVGLRKTMEDLESDGIGYTMLPQDLLMYDIDRRFGNVELPDGDF